MSRLFSGLYVGWTITVFLSPNLWSPACFVWRMFSLSCWPRGMEFTCQSHAKSLWAEQVVEGWYILIASLTDRQLNHYYTRLHWWCLLPHYHPGIRVIAWTQRMWGMYVRLTNALLSAPFFSLISSALPSPKTLFTSHLFPLSLPFLHSSLPVFLKSSSGVWGSTAASQ